MNQLSSLYAITDRKQLQNLQLKEAVAQAVKGGASFVQLREKDLSTRDLFALARDIKEVVKSSNGRLLINDRIDIALALQLDGVHLGQNGFPAKEARAILPKNMLLGVSTHSLAEAIEAESHGADFITLGPIYPTPSKTKYGLPIGLDILSQTLEKIRIPVYAIGGIQLDNLNDVINVGGKRVAVISAIIASSDVYTATRKILATLDKRF